MYYTVYAGNQWALDLPRPNESSMIHSNTFQYIPSESMSVWRFDVNLCLFELGYLKIDAWSSLSLRRWWQFLRTKKSPNYPTKPKYHSVGYVSHHTSISIHIPLSPYHMVSSPIVSFHSSRLQPVRCCLTVFSSEFRSCQGVFIVVLTGGSATMCVKHCQTACGSWTCKTSTPCA